MYKGNNMVLFSNFDKKNIQIYSNHFENMYEARKY